MCSFWHGGLQDRNASGQMTKFRTVEPGSLQGLTGAIEVKIRRARLTLWPQSHVQHPRGRKIEIPDTGLEMESEERLHLW